MISTLIIILYYFNNTVEHQISISEGSCDTEDLSKDAENSC